MLSFLCMQQHLLVALRCIGVAEMKCPVCDNDVYDKGSRDRGERHQYDCPCCGKFEITRTAIHILNTHAADDPKVKARLSHSIWLAPSDDDGWVSISSYNINEMMTKPLPSVHRQVAHLMNHLSIIAGDDYLAPLIFPPYEHMTARIGVVDKSRVHHLIKYTFDLGLTEATNGALMITPRGWEYINKLKTAVAEMKKKSESEPEPSKTPPSPQKTQAHCNTCGGKRESYVLAEHKEEDKGNLVQSSVKLEIIQCAGCKSLTFRKTIWCSEWDEFTHDDETGEMILLPGKTEEVWPAPSLRKKPEWADYIGDIELRSVLKEVYSSIDNNNLILASIGTRTILDRLMTITLDDPPDSFVEKVTALIDEGLIGPKEKETFLSLTDVGSASAHRGFAPKIQTVVQVLEAVEHILYRELVLPENAKNIKAATPERPPRKKKRKKKGPKTQSQ